jgi:hypothetical protein
MGPPVQALFLDIKNEEPQVAITIEKQKVIFLLDSETCFSVLPFSPDPRLKDKIVVQGISGQSLEHYFTQPLACSWGNLHFCDCFLVVPETPMPLLGQDLLSQLKVQILLTPRERTGRSHSLD